MGPQPEFYFQSTPLMVNGVLYSTAGTRRSVVALDPATGELLWTFSLNEGERGRQAPRRLSGRGHGFVFVFDRITGKPVWPIEERPVPKGDVPGGW